jgi:hypothetical protein
LVIALPFFFGTSLRRFPECLKRALDKIFAP